jgi:hypothetical protein
MNYGDKKMYSEEQIIRSMEYCIRQYEHPTEFSSCAYLMESPDDDGNEYYCKYYGGRCNDRYGMLKDAVKLLKTQKEKKLNPEFPYKIKNAHKYILFLQMEGILTKDESDKAFERLEAKTGKQY